MTRMMFIATAAFAWLLAAAALPAGAQITTKAKFALLVDAETGAVLYEKNSTQPMAPASMSKLMTLAVLFDQMKQGRLTPDNEFIVTEYAWRTGGAPSRTAAMFAPLGTQVKIADLIPGIIVQSGNDACIIVAEGIAGTEAAFAQVMNEYGRKIGLTGSNFVNSTGLPHPEHLTTAQDLARLALHIIKEFPDYYPYFKQRDFKYRTHLFLNRNPLVTLNIGADGLKTGHTGESGFGLVASAEGNGRRVVLVLNGLESPEERREEAVRLINWGLNSFRAVTVFEPGAVVGDARVWGGAQSYVKLKGDGAIKVLIPIVMKDKALEVKIVYQGPLKPPIKAGDRVAELLVTAESGTVSNRVPLYAAEDVDKGGVIAQGFDSLLLLAFGWLL